MPGVPPDAGKLLKNTLKGLFKRKKKSDPTEQQPSTTQTSGPAATSTGPAEPAPATEPSAPKTSGAVPSEGQPAPPAPAASVGHEPVHASAPTTAPETAHAVPAPAASTTEAPTATEAPKADAPALTTLTTAQGAPAEVESEVKRESAEGMSATSGPLDTPAFAAH